jgi:DNA-binding GntR family transcriptional regulator
MTRRSKPAPEMPGATKGQRSPEVRRETNGKAWTLAYESIKNDILSMRLKPGEFASEASISESLSISRTPVREALKMLEKEGLIVTEGRRKRVYILSLHEIREIFDLKKALEGHMALCAVERKTPADEADLRGVMDDIAEFATRDLPSWLPDHAIIREWLEIDKRYHGILFRMAGSKRAEDLVQDLNSQWHRLETGLLAMEGRLRRNVEEHRGIGDAVLAGDGRLARDRMEEHLENLKMTIITIMETFKFPA